MKITDRIHGQSCVNISEHRETDPKCDCILHGCYHQINCFFSLMLNMHRTEVSTKNGKIVQGVTNPRNPGHSPQKPNLCYLNIWHPLSCFSRAKILTTSIKGDHRVQSPPWSGFKPPNNCTINKFTCKKFGLDQDQFQMVKIHRKNSTQVPVLKLWALVTSSHSMAKYGEAIRYHWSSEHNIAL